MNEFGNKCLEEWVKCKDRRQSLKIKAPRQAGKTTFLLYTANLEERQGNRVVIYSRNTDQSLNLKSLYILKYGNPVLVYFKSITSRFDPSRYNYKFYDECIYPRGENNILAISSVQGNEMVFGIDWAIPDGFVLKSLEDQMGKERFNNEFNSGIIHKTPVTWKDRYKNDK